MRNGGNQPVCEEDFVTVRYRKKSSRRPPKKSDHKHVWADCVFEFTTESTWHEKTSIGLYCPVCGKVHNTISAKYRINTANPPFYCMDWSEEGYRELNPATRTLPTFQIHDVFSKFITKEDNGE